MKVWKNNFKNVYFKKNVNVTFLFLHFEIDPLKKIKKKIKIKNQPPPSNICLLNLIGVKSWAISEWFAVHLLQFKLCDCKTGRKSQKLWLSLHTTDNGQISRKFFLPKILELFLPPLPPLNYAKRARFMRHSKEILQRLDLIKHLWPPSMLSSECSESRLWLERAVEEVLIAPIRRRKRDGGLWNKNKIFLLCF